MFLLIGINCSPWHGWPWNHCPSLVGREVSHLSWWSQNLFYCGFFLQFSISCSSSCCFGLFSTNISARELISLCLPKEVHLSFLWDEIKPDKSQNLGLGRTFHWKVPVELLFCCIFCGIGNTLKPTFCVAWAPIATPSFPCVSSYLALLTQISIYNSYFSRFLWWHHWVRSHVLHGKWAEVLYDCFGLSDLFL